MSWIPLGFFFANGYLIWKLIYFSRFFQNKALCVYLTGGTCTRSHHSHLRKLPTVKVVATLKMSVKKAHGAQMSHRGLRKFTEALKSSKRAWIMFHGIAPPDKFNTNLFPFIS